MSLNSCSGETKRDTKRRSTLHTTFEKTASRTDEDDEDDDEDDDDKRSSSVPPTRSSLPPRARVCFFFVLRGRRERESDLVFSRRKNVEIDTRTSRGG